jgi:ABC-type hemin transport system ATPase subunit
MTIHYQKLSPNRPEFLGGGQWILNDLKDVTVLFGRNSSGKSILLRKLAEEDPKGNYTSPERAGNIAYDQNIMNQELNKSQRGSQRRGKNQAPSFRQETISRIGTLKMKIGDRAGRGGKLENIFSYLEKAVTELLPDFQFRIVDSIPPFELRRITNDRSDPIKAQPNELSSGEAELLTLALDLLTIANIWDLEENPQRLLLIDEPDTHLHPDLQFRLARFLIELVDRFNAQLIIATHSTTLLSSLGHYGRDRVGVIYLNNSLPSSEVLSFDKVLRELTTLLGGHALMAPLFSAPILLVEGDDDYRIWSQVPRHPSYRKIFATLPCHGHEIIDYQKALESLFGAIRDPNQLPGGYAIIDGDAPFPTHVAQKYVKILQLACREAENLYLTAEVLNKMGHTWPEAKEVIKEKASEYGQHAKSLISCDKWDRKNENIKDVMISLASILDGKKLDWTVRVGKTLGERRPVGELADFLGEKILDALW